MAQQWPTNADTAPQLNVETCPLCPPENHTSISWTGRIETWLQCDSCEVWYHAACLKLNEAECEQFDQYHCPNCVVPNGPSTYKKQKRKSSREHSNVNYAALDNGLPSNQNIYVKSLKNKKFAAESFQRVTGDVLTLDWVRINGLDEPIIIEDKEGLDMTMPRPSITVSDITHIIGGYREVSVMDVATQSNIAPWTMLQWADYFNRPEKDRILNVISLEISDTDLALQIKRPRIVRELDWTDQVWPGELKKKHEYPKVQLYCLMSVKDSFTDFHIDFGGSSVFYHILSGEKVFYFIEPTQSNLRKYEKWSSSADQATTFLGDQVKKCYKVHLYPGNTMIIPTGWIHAVHTPVDSIVIGGNFLHGINIDLQLAVSGIEKRTKVSAKFRFPYFEEICWYAGQHYLHLLRGKETVISLRELDGLKKLAEYLESQVRKLETNISDAEKAQIEAHIPSSIRDPLNLAISLGRKVISRQYGDISSESGSSSEEPDSKQPPLKLRIVLNESKKAETPESPGSESSSSSSSSTPESQPKSSNLDKTRLILKLKSPQKPHRYRHRPDSGGSRNQASSQSDSDTGSPSSDSSTDSHSSSASSPRRAREHSSSPRTKKQEPFDSTSDDSSQESDGGRRQEGGKHIYKSPRKQLANGNGYGNGNGNGNRNGHYHSDDSEPLDSSEDEARSHSGGRRGSSHGKIMSKLKRHK
ncbi:Clavaminate synthase-like protein [Basidiobolus meristosporus CBS 931.73]|uniref:JmjC domain-containing histone demethylation protein 1 n=1 Tax=Basidiobolus meristosporus CBS 931.73 TaxID=1314790 RepID=A0A1Y1YZ02_9FUNG|nr:Clavaminate synthase-like protein [Basidiobolus meristosporus CBS 931.73]|eukprot:ORY03104.1 Clavaminate synthase-like protein [Basidiobolus meristosporus CBS 931.73]